MSVLIASGFSLSPCRKGNQSSTRQFLVLSLYTETNPIQLKLIIQLVNKVSTALKWNLAWNPALKAQSPPYTLLVFCWELLY